MTMIANVIRVILSERKQGMDHFREREVLIATYINIKFQSEIINPEVEQHIYRF
jgi:hypothetical protein